MITAHGLLAVRAPAVPSPSPQAPPETFPGSLRPPSSRLLRGGGRGGGGRQNRSPAPSVQRGRRGGQPAFPPPPAPARPPARRSLTERLPHCTAVPLLPCRRYERRWGEGVSCPQGDPAAFRGRISGAGCLLGAGGWRWLEGRSRTAAGWTPTPGRECCRAVGMKAAAPQRPPARGGGSGCPRSAPREGANSGFLQVTCC